ncbi:transcriptional regulator, AraC family [Cnuella takakiae]|uniref:Transcriptional regulator, AraC family n=1 Tax=Cnuella takakiae TaxID=1302690 RepID=A0A1M5DBP2_9BACT|nr:AraC family transcriptional regulator [Cnuella takakiae]OLY94030.1 hypothetical protein BUE76_20665 [Cnuella takakiae]SHF64377.1 transcriptional regulator, AraC family [Cnuella takakiae]
MLFQFNRYSSLLLIFFVHGLVYALLLLRRGVQQDRGSDKWLAAFLFLCILYITPWMVGFAGWYDNQPYRDILFYTPFQQLLLIGPVVFFYVQSLLNPSFRFSWKNALHLLPAALYLIYSGVMVVTDKWVLDRYFFLASQQDPDFESWYQSLGFLSMSVYLLLSLRYYRLFRKLMVQVVSYADSVRFPWIERFLGAFLLMLLARVLLFGASFVITDDYSNSWWYFLTFALIYYFIAITGYGNTVEVKVGFRSLLLENRVQLYLPAATLDTVEAEVLEIETAAPDARPDPQWDGWQVQIRAAMEKEKMYTDPELSLTALARKLAIPAGQLSRIINSGFGTNFNDFVNGYRVAAVKAMIASGEHKKQTLLGIAFDCGFNSKATFNRAFLKATGLSPKAYIQQLS